MTLATKLRRLVNLYKLLWADDRLTELENTLREQVNPRLETAEMLKSSLDVPPHLLAEFSEWKKRTPIPAQPLVSVCVPTYNRARVLADRCVPSILGQTYKNIELIVVGDGCTDETADTLKGFDDPRLKFVNLPEREAYPADPQRRWMVAGTLALNTALGLARGDFVTHLDDDDEYLPERIEKLVRFAQTNGCDFVWHPFWIQDAAGRRTLKPSWNLAYTQVTTSSIFYRHWFTRIKFSSDSHMMMEPGDWNWIRRVKYINPVYMRYPEPLHIKHEA